MLYARESTPQAAMYRNIRAYIVKSVCSVKKGPFTPNSHGRRAAYNTVARFLPASENRTSRSAARFSAQRETPVRTLLLLIAAAIVPLNISWADLSRADELASAVLEIPEATAATLNSRYPRNVDDLRRIETQVQRVIAKAVPATVAVMAGRSAGSGVIVSPDGLVLTAAHVIGRSGRRLYVVLPDGRSISGRSLGANHDIDAGLIELDNPPADLPFLPMADSARLRPGQWVVTTGQPGGMEADRSPPVRLGRVIFFEDDLVCTDCTLVGGDSGGPLVNMKGEVVGIHSSIGPDITHNFHVAMSGFHGSWQRLLDGEVWGGYFDQRRPMLGVSGRTVDGQCLITRVTPGMPAEKAGVVVGDVILAIDGLAISSFQDLAQTIFFRRPGSFVELTILRDDAKLKLRVMVGEGPKRAPDDQKEDP